MLVHELLVTVWWRYIYKALLLSPMELLRCVVSQSLYLLVYYKIAIQLPGTY